MRPARPEDAAALAAISVEVWIGTYLKHGVNAFFADFALAEFTADRYREILASEGEYLFVSENTVGIDGFIRVSENRPGPVPGCSSTEITTLYVQPRHHGRGIGAALLDQAFAICRDLGFVAVWLTTNSENTPAIDFYTRLGFAKVGVTDFVVQDQAYPNDVFTRDVSPVSGDRPIHR